MLLKITETVQTFLREDQLIEKNDGNRKSSLENSTETDIAGKNHGSILK